MTSTDVWWQVVMAVTDMLSQSGVAYCLLDDAALLAQSVLIPEIPPVTVSVQWDAFFDTHGRLVKTGAGPIADRGATASFDMLQDGVPITVMCYRNSVVEADPDRVRVEHQGRPVWAKSVYFYLRQLPSSDQRVERITEMLRALQQRVNDVNAHAWNERAYDAWIDRHGYPEQLAARIREYPEGRLTAIARQLGDIRGRKIINLLGSHGSKAVALALLGGEVTVVDIAPDNARYATELAHAAGVEVRYLVSDVLALPEAELTGDYDVVLMELGVLHYFVDLRPLATIVERLLRRGGRMVLQDFHPISTKLVTSKGRKHKITGNYFDPTLHEAEVAYRKHLHADGDQQGGRVLHRRWTLGEIVTAFSAGLRVLELSEEPNTKLDDVGLPKTFTLLAEKW